MVAILCALVVILVIVLTIKHLQHLRFLSNFVTPGTAWPLIGHSFQFFNMAPDEIYPTMRRLGERDPERRKVAALLGPQRMVFVFHPETVEPLVNSSRHINKSFQYSFLLPWPGAGLVTSGGDKWRKRRKLLNPAFNLGIHEDTMAISNKNGDTLSKILLEDSFSSVQGGPSKSLDVFPYVSRCTLDVILESVMGINLDIQDRRCSEYSDCVDQLCHISLERIKSPWLWPEWVFRLTPAKGGQERCLKILNGYSTKIIQEKRLEMSKNEPSNNKHLTFIDLLMTVRQEDGLLLTDQDLLDEVNAIIFGGFHSTGAALSWTLLLLANHPKTQDLILEEQKDIFGDESSREVTQDVGQDDLCRMKYLECCIKEALRLYPAFPQFGRVIDEEGLILDGIPVPKGTVVNVSLIGLHRNSRVWEAPHEYRPERFIPGNRLNEDIPPHAYMPFSAGPRNCIGQRYAMTETKIILSKLLRKVELVKGDSVEDVKLVIDLVVKPKGGIKMSFRKRGK